MMDDLISRGTAIDEINEYLQGLDSCISEPDLKLDWYKNGLLIAIQELKELPTVDAIPVAWLKAHRTEYFEDWGEEPVSVEAALRTWQKEQEGK